MTNTKRVTTTPTTRSKTTTAPVTTSPAVRDGFSQQEIVDLQRAFRLFDVEGTGVIGIGSFRSVLESLLETDESSYPHLEVILTQLSGRSDDETMDFDGYLSLMASTSLQQRLHSDKDGDEANCQHVFNLFDLDGKGYITVEDLHRIATELGEADMTMEELQEMIDRACSKKTGKVTVKEFSKMMTLNLFQKLEETAGEDAYAHERS
jgi:Ca2+-binding EF-hand superfamily protein